MRGTSPGSARSWLPAAWLGSLLVAAAGVRVFRGALVHKIEIMPFAPVPAPRTDAVVDRVRFVTTCRSMPDPCRYAVQRPDGTLRVASSAELDSIVAGSAPAR
jgi:hypothetical protein